MAYGSGGNRKKNHRTDATNVSTLFSYGGIILLAILAFLFLRSVFFSGETKTGDGMKRLNDPSMWTPGAPSKPPAK